MPEDSRDIKPANDNRDAAAAPAKRCAICGKHVVAAFDPFCSGRCADVDLNRWLSGVYAVPVKPEPSDDDE